MRKSRIGIRKRRKKVNIIMILLFLIILPVSAIIIGSKITELWVVPTINTDDMLKSPGKIISDENDKEGSDIQENINNEAEKKESNEEVINLDSISIYAIQVASMSDDRNIELITKKLENHNLPNITYRLDGAYKVYTFASTKRDDMDNKINEVKKLYEDAYIGQIHIPQRQIRYSIKENKGTKVIIEDMNLLLKLLEQSSDSLYKSGDKEINLDNYKETLRNHEKLLNKISKNISSVELPKDFASADEISKMIEFQKKNITRSLKAIGENHELYKIQKYLLDNLFNTVEVIRK